MSSQAETFLDVKNLKKYFPVTKGLLFSKVAGWVRAVDDVSFTIENGKTFGLVGESGCGKTTTTKLILREEKPTAGCILWSGRDVVTLRGPQLREYRCSVQAIFQDPYGSLDPRMRVGSLIAEPMEVSSSLSRGEIRQRVEELLTQVGLAHETASRYPHEFSGGQRQRIALARSISLRPKLVILDEPVSALDVSIRADIMNLLKDIQDQLGIAYLLVAHNLATVRYMSHHVAAMYLGKIVEAGDTEEIYSRPVHPYTQALLSAALPFDPEAKTDRIMLQGEVPSAFSPPSGCRFHPRCSSAKPICHETEPELRQVGTVHAVACHLC